MDATESVFCVERAPGDTLTAHAAALDEVAALLATSSHGPVELAALFVVPSGDVTLGKVIAPPAILPSHIAPVRLPPALLPGHPLFFSLDLTPSYPVDDPAAIAVALSALERDLCLRFRLMSTVGITEEATPPELRVSLCPNPGERSLLVSAGIPAGLNLTAKYVVNVEELALIGRRPLLSVSSLCIPVGVCHDPRPVGDVWRAARSGDVAKLTTALLSGGSTGEGVADGRCSCIRIAIRYCLHDIVANLIRADAHSHDSADETEPLLALAVRAKASECVSALLAAPGIDVNAGAGRKNGPPLLYAVQKAPICRRRLLAFPGINLDAADDTGETALHRAASIGAADVIAELLEAGASVQSRNDAGETPLHLAATSACVSALLGAPGIDVNAATNFGYTPLHRAVGRANAVDERSIGLACIAALLSAPGIDPNAGDVSGSTPLHLAAIRGRAAYVQALLAAPGIDVDAQDGIGFTPLQHAVARRQHAAVAVLRQRGRTSAAMGRTSAGENADSARSQCMVQ